MSIEQIARRAGAATRAAVQQEVDVEAGLATFHATRMRRRRTRLAAGCVAAAAAVAVVIGLSSLPGSTSDRSVPPTTPGRQCIETSSVRCTSGGEYVVEGVVPYAFRLPQYGFSRTLGRARAPHAIDIYQAGVRAGVTVLDGAYPVTKDRTAMSAADLARWVAAHKLLKAWPPERTVVGGLPAWRVDVRVPRGRDLPVASWCNGLENDCLALLRAGAGNDWESGPWRGMLSRYLFVQGPQGQTVAIWSWALAGGRHAMEVNDEVIRTIDFRTGG